jgi:hypothetical protein
MTTTANGGLIHITGAQAEAANEESAAKTVVAAEKHCVDSAAGWDPYEVWRTRVNKPRMAREESAILESPGNR